eukprot:5283082-Amphidinium_carterae.1
MVIAPSNRVLEWFASPANATEEAYMSTVPYQRVKFPKRVGDGKQQMVPSRCACKTSLDVSIGSSAPSQACDFASDLIGPLVRLGVSSINC